MNNKKNILILIILIIIICIIIVSINKNSKVSKNNEIKYEVEYNFISDTDQIIEIVKENEKEIQNKLQEIFGDLEKNIDNDNRSYYYNKEFINLNYDVKIDFSSMDNIKKNADNFGNEMIDFFDKNRNKN